MIAAVPAITPVTTPDIEPTVAIVGAPLLHVPPVTASLSVVVAPAHMLALPVITDGGITDNVVVVVHPVANPQIIVTVPAEVPYTTPVADPIVAIAGALLLHVTPDVASLSVVFCPIHKDVAPVIGAGIAFTVTILVAMQPVVSV